MRKKHHIDSERLRSVKFHHHSDNIVITQKIYLEIKILIFLHILQLIDCDSGCPEFVLQRSEYFFEKLLAELQTMFDIFL